MSYNLSVYIPRVNNNVTEDYVKEVFRNHHIAIVERVDFVEVIKPAPGFEDKSMSAFVHFDAYFYDDKTDEMLIQFACISMDKTGVSIMTPEERINGVFSNCVNKWSAGYFAEYKYNIINIHIYINQY